MTDPQPIRDDTTPAEPPCSCLACRQLGPWRPGDDSPVMTSGQTAAPVDGDAWE